MIQALSHRFRQPIAAILYLTFYMQLAVPLVAHASYRDARRFYSGGHMDSSGGVKKIKASNEAQGEYTSTVAKVPGVRVGSGAKALNHQPVKTADNGGPNSPEAISFKAVGADNAVNLFTGDFSYSIPLVDVDGYPVNLFYNGGISMEQEA